jgi:hypothetical protein
MFPSVIYSGRDITVSPDNLNCIPTMFNDKYVYAITRGGPPPHGPGIRGTQVKSSVRMKKMHESSR